MIPVDLPALIVGIIIIVGIVVLVAWALYLAFLGPPKDDGSKPDE